MQVIGYTFEDGYCLCEGCCADESTSTGAVFAWDEGASRMYCDHCASPLREPLAVDVYDVAKTLKEIGCMSGEPQQLEARFLAWLEEQPEDLDISGVSWDEVSMELQ